MSDSVDNGDVNRKIKSLLVDGAKFTASGDLEKAVQCYTTVLDLGVAEPEPYVILARCLYQIGLKKNDMFGGAGEEDGESSEEEEADDDSEDDDDEPEQKGAQSADPRLYQFDHEEEDLEGGMAQPSVNAAQPDEDESMDEEPLEQALSPAEGFGNYLEGDVFENAMELLYRARIMYMDSSKPAENLPANVQSKLVEIYELLGDIDQELEDFPQAVRDYEEAIKLAKEVSSGDSEAAVDIYMKLAEALRWLDTDNYEDMTREQHKEYLLQISRMLKSRIKHKTSKDPEEDEARLERIKEDLQTLKAGKSAATAFNKEFMMQSILKQALEATKQAKVNDLSKMVKKSRKKKPSKN